MPTVNLASLGMSVSGMDTETVIKQLMAASEKRYDNTWKQMKQLEYKKSDYITAYNQMQAFRDTSFTYMSQSKLAVKSATVTSGGGSFTATAAADAAVMNHTLNISQVAEGVKLISSAAISSGSKDSLATQFGLSVGTFVMTVANGASTATLTVNTAGSINDFMAQLNNAGINLSASYDSSLDRVFLSTRNTGSSSGVAFTNYSSNSDVQALVNAMKLGITSDTGVQGKDAQFMLDGISLTSSVNTVTYTGVTYKFLSTTSGNANVAVSADIDAIVENVKKYIASYNSV
ncbi:MAG: flagellar filament capping protein FliD, partial [Negativicutes bacterium]|nr:flagellar filament capping protein FliD [Negativicutes bacterium]